METWNDVFRLTLGFAAERSLVSELRDWRNKWARQEPFSSDAADRALDSIGRLLTAGHGGSAPEADDVRQDEDGASAARLRRTGARRDAQGRMLAHRAASSASLKPRREVVAPHADVASGRYQQAKLAADPWQVHLWEGSDEYRDPEEFFRRTRCSRRRCLE